MAKIIEKIVSQPTAPSNTNVGWWNGEELKFYTNGEWKSQGGSSYYSLPEYFNNTPPPTLKVELNTMKSLKDLGVPKEYYDKLLLLKSFQPYTDLCYFFNFDGYQVYRVDMTEEYSTSFVLEDENGSNWCNGSINLNDATFSVYPYEY